MMKMFLFLIALASLVYQGHCSACTSNNVPQENCVDTASTCADATKPGFICYTCLPPFCAGTTFQEGAQVQCINQACTTSIFEPGTCCDGSGCPSGPPSCAGFVAVQGDPVVTGLKGQSFLFKGLHAVWFAALAERHLQWNWLLHVFEECEDGLMPTYVTRHALTLFSEDGLAEYEIEVGVKDVTKYNPGCPDGEGDTCLGEGSLEMVLNGQTITSPGEYELEEGASVRAFNNVGSCQIRRDMHMTQRLKKEEEELLASSRRRLDDEDWEASADLRALDVLQARLFAMEDIEACSAWIAEKRTDRDLFESPGGWASVYITTPTYAFQIDYRQEVDRCHAHVVDATMMLSPNDEGVC